MFVFQATEKTGSTEIVLTQMEVVYKTSERSTAFTQVQQAYTLSVPNSALENLDQYKSELKTAVHEYIAKAKEEYGITKDKKTQLDALETKTMSQIDKVEDTYRSYKQATGDIPKETSASNLMTMMDKVVAKVEGDTVNFKPVECILGSEHASSLELANCRVQVAGAAASYTGTLDDNLLRFMPSSNQAVNKLAEIKRKENPEYVLKPVYERPVTHGTAALPSAGDRVTAEQMQSNGWKPVAKQDAQSRIYVDPQQKKATL